MEGSVIALVHEDQFCTWRAPASSRLALPTALSVLAITASSGWAACRAGRYAQESGVALNSIGDDEDDDEDDDDEEEDDDEDGDDPEDGDLENEDDDGEEHVDNDEDDDEEEEEEEEEKDEEA